jgi:uncharacterized membrane protein
MSTHRLEAFSDGVIAVAITLLVLGLAVPGPHSHPHHGLLWALWHQWPAYAAYVVSFLTIGIIWINHHAMIGRLEAADHEILVLNLVLLMSIAILPFATNLVATYLRESSGQSVAAAIYSGAFLVMAVAFATLNRAILLQRTGTLREPLPLDERRQILSRSVLGLIPYAISVPIAFLSPYLTLAIDGALALYYSHPAATGVRRRA